LQNRVGNQNIKKKSADICFDQKGAGADLPLG